MDNAGCIGTLISVGVYMCHHIMPQATFVFASRIKIDVGRVRAELVQLGVANREPKFLLGFCQSDP